MNTLSRVNMHLSCVLLELIPLSTQQVEFALIVQLITIVQEMEPGLLVLLEITVQLGPSLKQLSQTTTKQEPTICPLPVPLANTPPEQEELA